MIHVDRSRIAKPAVLDSRKAMDERAAATRAFMTDKVDRQRRFEFRVYREPEIRIALDKLFNGKCAYCETKIAAVSTIDTELYRPKAGVSERPEHLGYWWLASDWDNLLTSCVDCNRTRVHAGERTGKGNRFPLANEDNRAFKPGEEAHEEPLLLDPCRDHPEEHLVFDALGRVVSDTRRGQTTISVVGLNRRHLVDARKGAATGIQGTIAILGTLLQDEQESRKFGAPPTEGVLERAVAQIRELQADSQEFAGMKRQLLPPARGPPSHPRRFAGRPGVGRIDTDHHQGA